MSVSKKENADTECIGFLFTTIGPFSWDEILQLDYFRHSSSHYFFRAEGFGISCVNRGLFWVASDDFLEILSTILNQFEKGKNSGFKKWWCKLQKNSSLNFQNQNSIFSGIWVCFHSFSTPFISFFISVKIKLTTTEISAEIDFGT